MKDASIRLQPRLFMLAHSGRHLLGQLQLARQTQRTFSEHLCPQPINWQMLKSAAPQRQTQVRSVKPLQLPSQAGISARLLGKKLSALDLETCYQLPDLSLDLIDPLGQTGEQLIIRCGNFKTFNSGNPTRQLLEYLATLLNIELSPLGFSCLRQGEQLRLTAHPLLAGWNLLIRQVDFPDSSLPRCSGGLEAGLSSAGSGQQAGQVAFIHWGPYQINQEIYQLALAFESPDDFATSFAEAFNAQLRSNELSVVWTPDQHLLLMPIRPGVPLEITALPPLELSSPDLRLDLPLPEGHFAAERSAQEPGPIEINGIALRLGPLPEVPDAEWLCRQINQASAQTSVHASVTPDQHLHLQMLHPQQPLIISTVPESLQTALGLQPMRLGEVDHSSLDAALTRWTLLLNQVLADLPPGSPSSQALHEAAAQIPALAGHFDGQLSWSDQALKHAPDPMLAYLERIMTQVDVCLQAPETRSVGNLRPLQLELELQPSPGTGRSLDDAEAEPPPSSTFDHKI